MKFNFNLSYSAYSIFKKSPLQFYFAYIKKAKATDKVYKCYGTAGNVVHNSMEDYINASKDTFDKHWSVSNVANMTGFYNKKLDRQKYREMFDYGKEFITDKFRSMPKLNFITELKFMKEWYGINVKGFIDLYIEVGDRILLLDWKTNSTATYELAKDQRLFYSWVIWKIKGIIPECEWVYFKQKKRFCEKIPIDELKEFDLEIQTFVKNLEEWGDDISKYKAGDWKGPFNQHKTLCAEEIAKRHESDFMEVHLSIRGNYVFFEGDVNPKLEQGIILKTKFDLPDKYFIQQAVKRKARGRINLNDVGTVFLYNRKFKCFPIGLLDKVKGICQEFASYYNKKVKIYISDKRDSSVLNRTYGGMPEKLQTDKFLRDYQNKAVEDFMSKKSGIINIATGGGKTLVATEIIRVLDAKTLWIIDRKELLLQTKGELEKLLGIRIGMIMGGTVDIQQVTIATIQSLHSKMKELQDYLYNVNFVCVDEYHKSAAETYQKIFAKLPNTKYRLGLTATPQRDDGKDPILFSILGDIVHQTTTKELEELGYLVKPTIEFHKMPGADLFPKKYSEDYKVNIVESLERNLKIEKICNENVGKKIIILTKQVGHGKVLTDIIFEAVHIHGKSKDREQIMENFRKANGGVLVMTISIGAEGLDIPDLDIIINAAANKGDVKSIQILGRVLRIFTAKSKALYIDFVDCGKHTYKHSQARMKAFMKQGHKVIQKIERFI